MTSEKALLSQQQEIENLTCALKHHQSLSTYDPSTHVLLELKPINTVYDEEEGWWQSCPGCLESEDGHHVRKYPYCEAFRSWPGMGCGECGGLGVVWHMSVEQK